MRLGVEVRNFSLAKGQTISHITIHYGVTGMDVSSEFRHPPAALFQQLKR